MCSATSRKTLRTPRILMAVSWLLLVKTSPADEIDDEIP